MTPLWVFTYVVKLASNPFRCKTQIKGRVVLCFQVTWCLPKYFLIYLYLQPSFGRQKRLWNKLLNVTQCVFSVCSYTFTVDDLILLVECIPISLLIIVKPYSRLNCFIITFFNAARFNSHRQILILRSFSSAWWNVVCDHPKPDPNVLPSRSRGCRVRVGNCPSWHSRLEQIHRPWPPAGSTYSK